MTVLAACALPLLAGAGPASAGTLVPAEASATGTTAAAPGAALTALAALPVKGRAAKTGYARKQFGKAWADTDHNGCDTRNDVLKRDLVGEKTKSGTHGCVVAKGTLRDHYSGKTISFKRGNDTSSKVQIDHVVALGDAWQTGAQGWGTTSRTAFANDPLNLLAVDGRLNEKKKDADAASWLPPNKSFRCDYVARQVAVKTRYRLWMTRAEADASAKVLSTCPDETLPGGVVAPVAPASSSSAPAPEIGRAHV